MCNLMIHSFRRYNCNTIVVADQIFVKEKNKLTLLQKRLLILLLVVLSAAALLGRLAVRAVLNLLLGGTLFGGNFL